MRKNLNLSCLDKYLSWNAEDNSIHITSEDIDTILKYGNNTEVFFTNDILLIQNTKHREVFKNASGVLLIFEMPSTQNFQEIANCIEAINDFIDSDATIIISSYYINENKTPYLTSLIAK